MNTAQVEAKTQARPRALVTGGSGFIGSHLTDFLLSTGHSVTVVDDLSTGRLTNLPQHPALHVITAKLADAIATWPTDQHFDCIYHLAAAVGVKLVIDDPIGCIETNVEQTAAILRFASRNNTPILIASSSEVYGKPSSDCFREDDDVIYGPTTVLRWSYAQTKAIDEYLALAYASRKGLPAVVVRLFNTVGPRQLGSYGMVLPRFVQAALDSKHLPVHGDGTQTRCFCDVRDVVRAMVDLMNNPACASKVFNLGSDQPISIADLARRVIAVLNSSSTIRHIPYSEAYAAGFEDLVKRRPSLERIRNAINFEPKWSLDQTIIDLAAHLKGEGSGFGVPSEESAQR